MTRRYKITLAYDGTNFAGFQVQPNQRTVQSVLEAAVNKMSKNSDYITIYGSGRTDAGVHALGQVVHFDFPHDIPAEGMLKGLNSMLPLDCEVVGCEIVPNDFHARFTTHGKRYMYRVSRGRFTNPVKRFYTGHYKYPLDIEKDEIIFEFCGNGFLYNQVRIMVATLLEIGNGKRPVHDFLRLYEVKDRNECRETAPASGLYLKEVYYD